jgi:hypothetical protein
MSVTAVLLQTWLVLPIFVPLALALLAFGHQFKLVRARDNTCIVISDGDRDVHVPLRHVAEVSLSWAMNPSTVTIRLRDRTVLGRRIIFVPKTRSVATRLEKLVQAATEVSCVHTAG